MADKKDGEQRSLPEDAANSGFNYNPILQKPASLSPVGKHGGFYYFGPPPDAGFSYGVYKDDQDNKVVSMRGEEMYSPFTGKPMEFHKEMSHKDAADLVQQGALAGMKNICSACGNPVVTNIDHDKLAAMTKVHCSVCGSAMPEALLAMKMAAGLDEKEAAKEEKPAAVAEEAKEHKDEEKPVEEVKSEEKEGEEPKEEQSKGEDMKVDAKVADIIAKLKKFQKNANAVAEHEDKEVAEKIECLSEEEKKMLAEELKKEPELKALADEIGADEAESDVNVLPGQPAAPAHKPDVSVPDPSPNAAKAAEEEEEKKAKAEECGFPGAPTTGPAPVQSDEDKKKEKEEAKAHEDKVEEEKKAKAEEEKEEEGEEEAHVSHASLRKVMRIAAKLKMLAAKAEHEEVKEDEDKSMAEEIEELSAEEKAMLADEVKKDEELKAVVSKIFKSTEPKELSASAYRNIFSIVAKMKVMAQKGDKATEAEDKATAEAIAKLSKIEQAALIKEIKADEELKKVAAEMEAHEHDEHEEEKKAKAHEDKEHEEEVKSEEEEEEGKECGDDKESPALEAEEMEDMGGGEASAVHFEPLATVADLGEIAPMDVKLERWNEDGENPFYNVSIKGSPVAQIYLMSQPNPEEIRATFVTETYANAIKDAIAKVGVMHTLKSINAKFFSTAVNKSKFANKLAAKVKQNLQASYQERVTKVRDELLHCVAIVLAGANKNFFADLDNSLKASLYEEMHKAGVYEPVRIIEAGFDAGADKFFEFVLNKAVEYMDMPKEALSEVAKAIGQSSTMARAAGADEAPTLAARLAASSYPVRADANQGTEQPVVASKADLRSKLQLSRKWVD